MRHENNGLASPTIRVLLTVGTLLLTSCGACPVPVRDDVVPAGVVAVRIATFNLKQFGAAKAGRPDVVEKLAAIIRRYELVAVQEIQDKNEDAPRVLLAAVNRGEDRYEMMLSPRTGMQPDDIEGQEQYAYYYRSDVIKPIGDNVLFDDSAHDYFQREPHVARFDVRDGCARFVLINVHTKPKNGVTLGEIAAIEHVFEWAAIRYGNNEHIIALGDFNAGCGYADEDDLDALPLHGQNYSWVIPHSVDTTLANSRCPYDRIVFRSPLDTLALEDWGIDCSFTSTSVSDHWPAWAEFHFTASTLCLASSRQDSDTDRYAAR